MRPALQRVVLVGFVVWVAAIGPVWCQEQEVTPEMAGWSRDYLMIVGSTTVFPLAQAVVERLSETGEIKKPMMQATGSGGGIMIFCAGSGLEDVDITGASRRMRKSEYEKCQENGVGEIVELRLGFDGIILAQSNSSKPMDLSFRDIYLALAEKVPDPAGGRQTVENPYTNWQQVNPDLPDRPIRVLGPSSGSGTRTIFNRLIMERGCNTFDWIRAMRKEEPVDHRQLCRRHRDDGGYVAAGENDAATVHRLDHEPEMLAVLTYPVLDLFHDSIQALPIDGVLPTSDTIINATYPVARPLYIYAKTVHVGHAAGLRAFLDEITSKDAGGKKGYLEVLGLVPLLPDERRMWADIARRLFPMSMD